jgi:lipid-A-disaccharide synthase
MPGVVTVTASVPNVLKEVRKVAGDWPTPIHITESDEDKFAAFDAADAALAASGTVTTELALAKTPMVVAYKMGWLTFVLMRPLVRARFANLANIVLDREAVPEFIQWRCRPHLLADALLKLMRDAAAREAQLRDLGEALKALGLNGERPSLRAARAVLELADRR